MHSKGQVTGLMNNVNEFFFDKNISNEERALMSVGMDTLSSHRASSHL